MNRSVSARSLDRFGTGSSIYNASRGRDQAAGGVRPASRCSSFVCSTPPNACTADRRASSGARPRLRYLSSRQAKWDLSSRASARSARPERSRLATRATNRLKALIDFHWTAQWKSGSTPLACQVEAPSDWRSWRSFQSFLSATIGSIRAARSAGM